MDELYDVTANSILGRLSGHQEQVSKGTAGKWMTLLQAADLPDIPSSTAYAERNFSSAVICLEQVSC